MCHSLSSNHAVTHQGLGKKKDFPVCWNVWLMGVEGQIIAALKYSKKKPKRFILTKERVFFLMDAGTGRHPDPLASCL